MYANCLTADSELNACFDTLTFRTDTWQTQDRFATMPVLAVVPAYQPSSEEELHTSFEEAISKRSSARHRQLSHPSLSTENMYRSDRITSMYTTQNSAAVPKQSRMQLLPSSTWQRYMVLAGLALIFMLIGFDLMGLLILHMR